jgi:hypothetical protein
MALVKMEIRRQLSRIFNLTLEEISLEKMIEMAGGESALYE